MANVLEQGQQPTDEEEPLVTESMVKVPSSSNAAMLRIRVSIV